ncbi:MAG TPA: DUF1192 domain-containing protein [Bauldia sp.]|nr:DUF1192 domain-containing protein [Bauldia sp.]
MPIFDEEPVKKKKAVHELGEELAPLSVDELMIRIQALRDEIARLEAAIAHKRASANVAASVFKR